MYLSQRSKVEEKKPGSNSYIVYEASYMAGSKRQNKSYGEQITSCQELKAEGGYDYEGRWRLVGVVSDFGGGCMDVGVLEFIKLYIKID